jgi:hypothetical protein
VVKMLATALTLESGGSAATSGLPSPSGGCSAERSATRWRSWFPAHPSRGPSPWWGWDVLRRARPHAGRGGVMISEMAGSYDCWSRSC